MHEIKLPQLGQTVEEAAVVQWYKQEGDQIEQGDPLFSVQTDKAEIECESPAGGVLRKILVEPDVTVPVLTVIALVGNPDEPLPDLTQYEASSAGAPLRGEGELSPGASKQPALPAALADKGAAGLAPSASPRATRRAKALDIDLSEVPGTGAGGRVMEEDVLRWAGMGAGDGITKGDAIGAPESAEAGAAGGVRRVPLTPMRRIIAERMVHSFQAAPHYYISVEVDMAAAARFRQSVTGFKPSYNDLILYACARALGQFPRINARWAGDAIEEVVDVNLGFAVSVPTGLVVPVVRQAQNKGLEAIHRECRVLIKKALTGKLTPEDYSGNTFTISNLGSFGIDQFLAIINPPDSAILAVGQIKDRPVAIEGKPRVRPVMNLTLSSDHRIIDGALAAQFMGRLKEVLETGGFSG